MAIETVFFDLGNTLLYNREVHREKIRRACAEMANEFRALGYTISPEELAARHFENLTAYYDFRELDYIELSADMVLRKSLREMGLAEIPEQDIIRLLHRFYSVTQQNWFLTPGVPETLSALKASGRKIGLITNASYEADVRFLLKRHHLENWLDPVIISARVGFRKPRREIFAHALELAGGTKETSVMVGDSLLSDMYGAGKFGMGTIWFKKHLPQNGQDLSIFTPDRSTLSMEEIPLILENWENKV